MGILQKMDYNEGLAKLEGRAKLATIALWVFAGVTALTGVGGVLQLLGVVDIAVDTGPLAMALVAIYLGYTVVFLVSVVVVAMWIYRAHANLAEVGTEGLEFSPGWAIGWFFVPFANLFKPFQAMRELWTASHAEPDSFGAPAPAEVATWWGAWIVGNILSSISTRIELMGGDGGAGVATIVDLAGAAALIAAAVLLVRIIAGVTAAQRGGSSAVAVFA